MRSPTLLLVLLTAACQRHGTATPPARSEGQAPQAVAPAPPPAVAAPWTPAQQACVDRWLGAHAFDAYGSPEGTMYPGGTPLFDEASGQRTSRQDFLAKHRPEALRSCGL
ncbi:MAG: hypothetical protein ACLPJH_19660 [Myxococcaceae bacterium]